MNATGYIELLRHLDGDVDLETAVEQIRAATRRYARRQLTWLRHQLPPDARRLDATAPPDRVAERIVAVWREREGK